MKVKVQVNIGQMGKDLWMDMRPSRGVTYVFDDQETAERTARMCYPCHPDKVRVVPLDQEEDLLPGSCRCGSTKYRKNHQPSDHAGWSPD
jgi:hypothetical protein